MYGKWAKPRLIKVSISIATMTVLGIVLLVLGKVLVALAAFALAGIQLWAMIVGFNPG